MDCLNDGKGTNTDRGENQKGAREKEGGKITRHHWVRNMAAWVHS